MDGETGTEPIDEGIHRLPAPALRPLVAWYSGYRQAGLGPATHRGLPSPYLTWIITIGEPITIASHPSPGQAPGCYDGLLGGLHTTPALIVHQGSQHGIQLALTPLGSRVLLGLPAAELARRDVEAADVLGRFESELRERVAAASTWPERFAVLDEMLLARLGGHRQMPREVAAAWRLLTTGGPSSVEALARATGWSSRHLRERFRTEIGLTPKAAARVVRFDRARRLLQRRAAVGGPAALADLAAACGYFDQAHLAREFRDFAGCSPSRWLTEEFRNIQAWADLVVPESEA